MLLLLASLAAFATPESERKGKTYWSEEHGEEVRTWIWVEMSSPVGWGGLADDFERCAVGYLDDPDAPPEIAFCMTREHLDVSGDVDWDVQRRFKRDAPALKVGDRPLMLGTIGRGRLYKVIEGRMLRKDGEDWVNQVTTFVYFVGKRGWLPLYVDSRPKERCPGDCTKGSPLVDAAKIGGHPGPVLAALADGKNVYDRDGLVQRVRTAILGDVTGELPTRQSKHRCRKRFEPEEVAIALLKAELAALERSRDREKAGTELAEHLACAVPYLSREARGRGLRAVGNTRKPEEAFAWWSAARVFDSRMFAMTRMDGRPNHIRGWRNHPIIDWSHLPLALAITDSEIPEGEP